MASLTLVASYAQGTTAGPTVTIPLTADCPAGSTLLVFYSSRQADIASITDTKGNAYAVDSKRIGATTVAAIARSQLATALTVAGADNISLTHTSSPARQAIRVYRLDGATASPLDKVADNQGTTSPVSSGVTAATTQADEMVIGCFAPHAADLTATGGATLLENFSSGGTTPLRLSIAYKIVAAIGTQEITGTIAGTDLRWAGCIATYKLTAPPPSPVADFSATPLTGDAPLAVAFTDLSTGSPTSWDWDFGDGSAHGTTQNPSHNYTTPGTYTVALIATNAGGSDTETKTAYITVTAAASLNADFTASPTSGAAPLTVAFTDTSLGTPTGWEWDFQNDAIPDSFAQNPSYAYALPGTYSVRLRVNKTGSFDVELKTAFITVTPGAGDPPTAAFSATPTGIGLEVDFTDLSSGEPAAWDWDFGDGSPIVHLMNPIHEYAVPGTYTVTLTVHNAAGSDSTASAVELADPGDVLAGVSVAFEDSMLEPFPAWTRLDSVPSLVAEYSIRRGRQDEFEKTGTGTASIRINDTEGLFDPTNPASPYLGIMDGRQIGIGLFNPCTGEWHTIFRGVLDEYQYDVHPSGVVTHVEMDAVDGMDYLANVEIAPGVVTSSGSTHGHDPADADPPYPLAEGDVYYLPQTVDDRIHKLLGDAEWPVALRTIFTGNVFVKEQVVSAGTPVLALLGDAADAEFPGVANIYVSRNGKVTFHGRLARFDPDTTSGEAGEAWVFTRWKAGDGSATSDPTYAQLRGLSFARQRKLIINAALSYPFRDPTVESEITEAEMAAQVVTDPASVEIYGVRSWSAENLMTLGHAGAGPTPENSDLEETQLFAAHYVANYAQPQTRLTQLVFRSLHPSDPRAPATWALICGVEISDTVKVKTNHAGAGGFANDEFYVEGISYEVRPLNGVWQDVTLTLDVSPVAYYTSGPFAPP